MNFAAFLQRHRRSLLFLAAALAVGGIFAAFKLPVGLLPNVPYPHIVVELDAGNRPASQVELAVTRPVENAVRDIPGVQSLHSITSRGSAQVSVYFDWGLDMTQALLEVSSKISLLLPDLPADTRFTVERRDPTVFPVIAYSLTSSTESLVQLRDIGLYQLRPLLSRVTGVAQVDVQGGHDAEYHVDVDPARLRAFHLSLADVVNAVSGSNVLTAVGRLEDHYKLYLLVSDTRLQDIQRLEQVVLRHGPDGLVILGDVAKVSLSTVPQWIRVTANGRDAVLLNIFQQPGANTVQIDRDIDAQLAAYRAKLPPDVRISKWYDQSGLIVSSAHSVRDAIIIGIILAALVLFFFLRERKVAFIAILVVPTTLAITVLLLYTLHMSFNIMTLGGIAAAVGLVIDDVVVMCEHIVRRFREVRGQAPHERIMWAAREFTRPLMGSSASTIIIFIPLAFLGGISGAFFKSLALTMASTLVISFLLAWLVVPVLADWWLSDDEGKPEHFGRLARNAHRFYSWLMPRLLKQPLWLLAGLIPLAILGFLGYRYVGTGFLPNMDQGGFTLDYLAAPGTSLSETDRLLRQVGRILQQNPNVESYSRRTGAQLGGGITEANTGDFFVRLKPFPREPIAKVMDEVRSAINAQVPGLDIDLSQLMEDMIGDLTSVPQPVEIKLFSDNTAEIQALAPKVADAIGKVPGIVDVFDGVAYAGPALDIHVNITKAGLLGLDPAGVTQQLDTYLQGTVAAQVQQGIKFVGIRVWTPPDLRLRSGQLEQIPIRAPDGKVYPLSEFASITSVDGQAEIDRDNLKRMFAVTARISGRDLGSTINDVKKVLATPGLIPPDVEVQLGGLYKQQQVAFRGLAVVFAAAVALIFVLLLFLYERFRVVLAIVSAPLLAVATVFFALWITGIELNITAIMGMTMIVGIVTEVAIFYFSEFVELKHAEHFEQALVNAGLNRMRAIALTTLTTTLALLPLALNLGRGAAMQQPLAIAIIAGEAVQLPLVLVVMPVIYYLLMRGRYHRDDPALAKSSA
ncbi:MAG: efflux RND transporter permease subunit [Gammaproteobacteria bacterium]|nr:efflux RND transporter permease subunit [Gammaproteobacteria bacterium]